MRASRMLQNFQREEGRQAENRRMRWFVLLQIAQFGAVLALVLGGVFLVVFAAYVIL